MLTVAGGLLVVLPMIFFFMRDSPAQSGLRPYGLPEGDPVIAPDSVTNPIAEAISALGTGLRSRDFWLLAGSFFICGAQHERAHRYASCPSLHGPWDARGAGGRIARSDGDLFDLIGTTASGWLSDRFSNRWLLFHLLRSARRFLTALRTGSRRCLRPWR